jgi:hypothetical protein
MRLALAALAAALGALAVAPAPAKAESSYWEERWRSRDSTPEYRSDRRRYREPDHVDIRVHKRARPAYARRGYPPRSYNGPVYQTQEQVQQSVYDFATGGVGDINAYRY